MLEVHLGLLFWRMNSEKTIYIIPYLLKMSTQNKKYWLGLAKIPSIGPIKFNKLLKFFKSAEEAYKAPITALEELNFGEKCVAEFIRTRSETDLDLEMEKHEQEGIKITTQEDNQYPSLLKQIYDPPAVLFSRGLLPAESEFLIAVVGSRKHTTYGKIATEKITLELSKTGITIVSGLALGIDEIAHRKCVEEKTKTIAVLGCGIEKQNIYPSSNKILAERIIEQGGCVLSEYPIGTPPYKSNFPQRNRIISGLCLGVVVVEAAIKSGALITAKSALDQNREVFAVPGPITSAYSEGTNNLIKSGATLVVEGSDILESLNLKQAMEFSEAKEIIPQTKEEGAILECIFGEPMSVDEIIRRTKINPSEVISTLTLMEMKGIVKNLGSSKYALSR